MTLRSRFAAVVVVLIALSILAIDTRAQPSTGTVSGVVVSDASPPRPVRRATVNLVAPDLAVPLSTITDDQGWFTFAGVPVGHYGIAASRVTYVGAFYGSKRPGRGPGIPVAVAAGAKVDNLSLTLTRGAVITGTLRLPSGERALNMPVTAVAVETTNGVTRLRYAGGRNATDDRGQYRIFGLPAGEYLVIAQPSGLIMGSPTGINDTIQTTPAEVSWIEETTRPQPGSVAADVKPPPRGRPVNYAHVFYPGTANSSLAQPVRVGPGEERQGVDFALALVSTASVSGMVVDRNGAPVSGASIVLRAPDDLLNLAGVITARAPVLTGADGTFSLSAVGPGRYHVVARAAGASDLGIWAQQDLLVDGRDIASVSLQLQTGLTVSGRLHFSGATPAAESDVTRARITLSPVAPDGTPEVVASGRAASAPVAADGTFVVSGLVPASYRLGITTPAGWSLLSVDSSGADVADRAIDLRPGEPLSGLVATLTDRPTELTGTLSDQAGRPAPGYPIVVYSTDRANWRSGSRRVAVARPATDGTFRLIGLPPGAYYMAAVVSLDPSEISDPSFLDQLVPASLTVALTPGAPIVQTLRLVR